MKKVYFTSDLAHTLGMSEAAIRSHVQRRSKTIPMPFKLGRRNAWRAEDIDKWLQAKPKLGSF